MESLSLVQWVVLGAIALLLWSSGSFSSVTGGLSSFWSKITTSDSVNPVVFSSDEDNVAAFKVIQKRLPSTLAKQVWEAIQPTDLGAGT